MGCQYGTGGIHSGYEPTVTTNMYMMMLRQGRAFRVCNIVFHFIIYILTFFV